MVVLYGRKRRRQYSTEWLVLKIQDWIEAVEQVAEMEKFVPQSAYAGMRRALARTRMDFYTEAMYEYKYKYKYVVIWDASLKIKIRRFALH